MANLTIIYICLIGTYLVNARNLEKREVRMQGTVAEDGQYPFIAGMWISEQVGCTATILNENHLLTSYSCVLRVRFTHVLVGTNNWNSSESGQLYPVAEWIGHPDAPSVGPTDDIAVVRLSTPIQFNAKVQPVKLSETSEGASVVTMIGWSSFWSVDAQANIRDILYMDVTAISNAKCKSAYENKFQISESVICTVNENGEGPCGQDAGNPLMLNDEQIGLASYAKGDYCRGGLPDLFTDVTSYLDWIKEVIGG